MIGNSFKTVDAIENRLIKEAFIQRWAIGLASGVILVAVTAFVLNFHDHGISSDSGNWGELGDYLGGLINPFVGLLTIWLLCVSLRQNHMALSQARRELELTRTALEQAQQIQKATEAALAKQISLAEQARDFSNAAALYNAIDEDLTRMRANYGRVSSIDQKRPEWVHLKSRIDESHNTLLGITRILNREAMRLIAQHDPH